MNEASAIAPPATGAYYTGRYRNVLVECGFKATAVRARVDDVWNYLFYGNDDQRLYFPVGTNMAYILSPDSSGDPARADVRTEGMSYAMMIAVQLNKKDEFDRLWRWLRRYMYNTTGPWAGYYTWHVRTDGSKIYNASINQTEFQPAPDGEEWLATALMFASARWGDWRGINYSSLGRAILQNMRTRLYLPDGKGNFVTTMINPQHGLVNFTPWTLANASNWTDTSYHLPAFYTCWSLWPELQTESRQFWAATAGRSREFIKRAAHPATGLTPNWAEFSGAPKYFPGSNGHRYGADAWRVASNVALDYAWFAPDPWAITQSNRLLNFFFSQDASLDFYPTTYELDGKLVSYGITTGLKAMNATASLAATTGLACNFVESMWNAAPFAGTSRYYHNLLYMLGLLQLSGNFRVYVPRASSAAAGTAALESAE